MLKDSRKKGCGLIGLVPASSVASSDFVPLAPRAAAATWLSVQIVVCSFTSHFFRQLVTQSSIVATSVWKAVASCPSEMCHCILLWYLRIPATVPYWLQALSVNQTCPFLSWYRPVFHRLFFSQYHYPVFTESGTDFCVENVLCYELISLCERGRFVKNQWFFLSIIIDYMTPLIDYNWLKSIIFFCLYLWWPSVFFLYHCGVF